jgi:hypothetical protein
MLSHPGQYWGWTLLFAVMMFGLITIGILINRRFRAA